MSFLDRLFGSNQKITIEALKQGTLIDVRTPEEYRQGHHTLATNIPLDQVQKSLSKIQKMQQPIYLCCASGGRSGQAQRWLSQNNITCSNLGGWANVPK